MEPELCGCKEYLISRHLLCWVRKCFARETKWSQGTERRVPFLRGLEGPPDKKKLKWRCKDWREEYSGQKEKQVLKFWSRNVPYVLGNQLEPDWAVRRVRRADGRGAARGRPHRTCGMRTLISCSEGRDLLRGHLSRGRHDLIYIWMRGLCCSIELGQWGDKKRGLVSWGKATKIAIVQSLNPVHIQFFATPWTVAHQASLSFINSWSLLKLMSIKLVMSSNRPIFCCPISFSVVLFSSHLQSFPASGSFLMSLFFTSGGQSIGASASASVHWIFNEISPSNKYSGLISFRIDWFDLLAVQGTLKSLLQYHGLKNINSLVFSLIYGPTLTSVHDYWKNNSFDYRDLCWLLSSILSRFVKFFFKEASIF